MSNSTTNYDYLLKFIIIGDSAVGKSNILLKYIHDKFNEEFQSTIGVEFGAKNLKIEDKIYRIQIWDTAGQETFRSITRAYYKNSVCSFLVYDISNRASFQNIQIWIDDCKKQTSETVLLVLIGNKEDLENKREVSYEEGESFAQKNGMLFFETSAKTGKNIEEMFLKSTYEISKKISAGYYDLNDDRCGIKQGFHSSTITLISNEIESGEEKKGCC